MNILQLLSSSLAKRKTYISKNHLEAFRLYNQENIFFECAIDIYGENAVIHIFGSLKPEILHDTEQALQKLLPIKKVFYKDRMKKNVSKSSGNTSEKSISNNTNEEIIVKEYGHNFLINLSDYLDLGLFLDHRENRRFIGALSKDKIVLNTFAYTGSFSIYAAKAGAKKTYSVDLSKTYCEWIKKNLELNQLPSEQNWVYKMDTFEFFKYARKKQLIFDIIIIDPPTFSKNKGEHFSVEKDHPRLINEALNLLTPEGFILFSNNYKNFKLKSEPLEPCNVKRQELIPPDFSGVIPHQAFIIEK